MRLSSSRRIGLLLGLFAALSLVYGAQVPLFEGSDEAEHFLYVHHILATGELPLIQTRDEAVAQAEASLRWANQSHHPPLYYLGGALLTAWSSRSDLDAYLVPNDLIFLRGRPDGNPNKWLHPLHSDGDTALAMRVLRLYSLVLTLLALLCMWAALRIIFPRSSLPDAALLLLASLPTLLIIGSSVSNDALVICLVSLGLYLGLRTWQQRRLRDRDGMLLGIVLGTSLLAKLTGAILGPLLLVILLLGVWRGHYTWGRFLRAGLWIAAFTLLVAGWWFLRNAQIYGDPLALSATQGIWGREFEIGASSGDAVAELLRIGRSFWMMSGYLHAPVYASDAYYGRVAILASLGLLGAAWGMGHRLLRGQRIDGLAILLLTVAGTLAVLLFGTRSVDISYGRLLFPGLLGFSGLLVYGWRRIFGTALGTLCILPLTVSAWLIAFVDLPAAYPGLQEAPPDPAAQGLYLAADGLFINSIRVNPQPLGPGDTLEALLSFERQATMGAQPALLLTALDAITLERLGYTEIYPGQADLRTMPLNTSYQAQLRLVLDEAEAAAVNRGPRQILLSMQWWVPGADAPLPLRDGTGQQREQVAIDGPAYAASQVWDAPQGPDLARFGEFIALEAAVPDSLTYRPGEAFSLRLDWRGLAPMDEDWQLTLQLFDADGDFVAQVDGAPPGYPTRIWPPGWRYSDLRTLIIPEDIAPDSTLRLRVGWYRLSDGQRLLATAELLRDNLVELPFEILPVP